MDVNNEEDTGLQEENAFLDATHMRVFVFKSFRLWLVHSSMREMVCLASMEMSENSEDIAIFFRLFNEMLEKVSGIKNYKFTPRCFLCDEAGANCRAVRIVHGDEFCQDRVCGCQFHFKQQIQNKKNKVPLDMRETFIETCKQLCTVTTVAKYKILKGRLEEMAESVPTLYSWIEWWDDRRAQIFGPYRGGGLPGCNLSEQGNASWKPTNTMCLVHAAHDDVSSMIFQEVKVYLFDRNLMRLTGRARSKPTRDAQDRAKKSQLPMILLKPSVILLRCYSKLGKHCIPLLIYKREGHLLNPQKPTKRRMKKIKKNKQNPKSRKHKDVPPT